MEPSSCHQGSNTNPSHVRWNRKHRRRPPWQFVARVFHLSRVPLFLRPGARAGPVQATLETMRSGPILGISGGAGLLQYVVIGKAGARALPWQPQAPDRSRNGDGTGAVGILQADKRCVGQDRSRPSNPPEQNRAFFIGNRRYCIDRLIRWIVAQQAFEYRTSLDPPHSTEGGCRRCCHPPVQIDEEIYQNQDQLRQRTGAAAGIGSDAWLGMS